MIAHAARLLVLDPSRALLRPYLWFYVLLPFSTSVWSLPSHRCYRGLPACQGTRSELYTVRAVDIPACRGLTPTAAIPALDTSRTLVSTYRTGLGARTPCPPASH